MPRLRRMSVEGNKLWPVCVSISGAKYMDTNRGITRVLWVAVILLALIGVAVATRRATVLVKPGAMNARKNPAAGLDEHFAKEKTLTLLHVLPGMIFMILGPLQF